MEILERAVGDVFVFELSGRLTLESFGGLKTRVRELVAQGGRALVLNLSRLHYVDSIGVSELVRSHVMMERHGGRLVLAAAPGHLLQLLTVTRLDQIFERSSTERDAVRRLAAGAGV